MKTILTENWILDEAKYLFSTEKFHFVETPQLFQFLLEGQSSAVTLCILCPNKAKMCREARG